MKAYVLRGVNLCTPSHRLRPIAMLKMLLIVAHVGHSGLLHHICRLSPISYLRLPINSIISVSPSATCPMAEFLPSYSARANQQLCSGTIWSFSIAPVEISVT